jgi:hypothetical protein
MGFLPSWVRRVKLEPPARPGGRLAGKAGVAGEFGGRRWRGKVRPLRASESRGLFFFFFFGCSLGR